MDSGQGARGALHACKTAIPLCLLIMDGFGRSAAVIAQHACPRCRVVGSAGMIPGRDNVENVLSVLCPFHSERGLMSAPDGNFVGMEAVVLFLYTVPSSCARPIEGGPAALAATEWASMEGH
jgi:hypothetical protein